MTPSASEIRVQDIDHCALVAGIIDQMCLVEKINQILGTHHQEIVSPGQAVKAMILNGLGLVSAPLYLFEKFFVGKATEHLLGEGISPEHLNDDRLGRVLDKLYEAGLTQVFVTIALAAAEAFVNSAIAGYQIAECCSDYAGVKQRWLVVESEARKSADLKQLETRLAQHLDKAQSQLRVSSSNLV
jgi:transposase